MSKDKKKKKKIRITLSFEQLQYAVFEYIDNHKLAPYGLWVSNAEFELTTHVSGDRITAKVTLKKKK